MSDDVTTGDATTTAAEPSTHSEAWVADLRSQVQHHPAVNHMLLSRLATGPYTRTDYKNFALQHYALVGCAPRYMEMLLLRAPTSAEKLRLARILIHTYGDESGVDGPSLYRQFLRACGIPDGEEVSAGLCKEVWAFVREHLRICREEPFLVGLGALGPGHEWVMPRFVEHMLPGLRRAGFTAAEISYFTNHGESAASRAESLAEELRAIARTPAQEQQIARGANLSLELRFRLWTGIERAMVSSRHPEMVRALRRGLHGPQRGGRITARGSVDDLRVAVSDYTQGRPWSLTLQERSKKKRETAV